MHHVRPVRPIRLALLVAGAVAALLTGGARSAVAQAAAAQPARPDTTVRADSAHKPKRKKSTAVRTPGKKKAPSKAAEVAALAANEPPFVQPPMPAPLPGSLLPSHRIVTYYGNPLSKRMGILGEIPVDEMLARLEKVAAEWQQADTTSRVLPGLELVATVASNTPGPSGLYRTRMRDTLIERVIQWADRKKWLVILDVQVGNGSVKDEVERLLPFLERPNVHLALDPEFELPKGVVPGTKIGSTDAAAVNVAIRMIGDLVTAKKLTPKVLIVHRFTKPMLTHYQNIKLDARVQLVTLMDGFGPPWMKQESYRRYIRREPVQYAGFKLFYKNDQPLMSPRDVLKLVPIPWVIIYQ